MKERWTDEGCSDVGTCGDR